MILEVIVNCTYPVARKHNVTYKEFFKKEVTQIFLDPFLYPQTLFVKNCNSLSYMISFQPDVPMFFPTYIFPFQIISSNIILSYFLLNYSTGNHAFSVLLFF